MSPQLTLSSLFCTLALGLLCVVTSLADLTGVRGAGFGGAPAPAIISMQAEAMPDLLP